MSLQLSNFFFYYCAVFLNFLKKLYLTCVYNEVGFSLWQNLNIVYYICRGCNPLYLNYLFLFKNSMILMVYYQIHPRSKSTRVKIHPIKIHPSQNPPDQNQPDQNPPGSKSTRSKSTRLKIKPSWRKHLALFISF